MNGSLRDQLEQNAAASPDAIWLTSPETGQQISWKEALSQAQTIAAHLKALGTEEGASIELDQVLMINNENDVVVGKPFIEGGKVSATVKSQGRAKKVNILKFRRRKHHMKKMGHRQSFTEIKINKIEVK